MYWKVLFKMKPSRVQPDFDKFLRNRRNYGYFNWMRCISTIRLFLLQFYVILSHQFQDFSRYFNPVDSFCQLFGKICTLLSKGELIFFAQNNGRFPLHHIIDVTLKQFRLFIIKFNNCHLRIIMMLGRYS